LVELWFYVPLDTTWVTSETVPQANQKNLKLTQQKDAFTNQKKCNTTQNKHEKLKPGLVAFYDIRPGNGAPGLFSRENINKKGIKKTKVKKDK